ncbi:hypothetical protein [Phormidesmis sp. 146-33]
MTSGNIFTSDSKQITTPPNPLIQPLVSNYSIFALEGHRHRRERRLLMPPFHSERMRTYGSDILSLLISA